MLLFFYRSDPYWAFRVLRFQELEFLGNATIDNSNRDAQCFYDTLDKKG